jgi:ABC-type lipoprotein release transport system permease subunit
LTIVAVALGLTVLLMMSGMFAGVAESGLRDNIRLNTGHLQLRDDSYQIEKMSLLSRDLLQDSEALVAQAEALSEVQSAAPVLWASGVLSTIRESTGLQVTGIDPADDFHDPIRQGIVEGRYLTADDRGQILIGKRLADDMDIEVGQRVSLAAGNADGALDERIFTVAGLFNTGIPNYDRSTVVMPLAQAQSFTRTRDRASSIIVMLNDREDTGKVAAALGTPGVTILTWQELNQVLLQALETGIYFYYLIYAIVILVVAVLIANTLLMSVFERTREMGILAALGMKRRQIMLMVLFEAVILALIGIVVGLVLGMGVVTYMAKVGLEMGDDVAGAIEGTAFSGTMYAQYAPADFIMLSLAMLAVVTLVSLYPAWYAARMEPVEALHAF